MAGKQRSLPLEPLIDLSVVLCIFCQFRISDRFFIERQKHFDDLFEKWKADNVIV
jgi:hypothetical protein